MGFLLGQFESSDLGIPQAWQYREYFGRVAFYDHCCLSVCLLRGIMPCYESLRADKHQQWNNAAHVFVCVHACACVLSWLLLYASAVYPFAVVWWLSWMVWRIGRKLYFMGRRRSPSDAMQEMVGSRANAFNTQDMKDPALADGL